MGEPERLHILVQAALFEVRPVSRGQGAKQSGALSLNRVEGGAGLLPQTDKKSKRALVGSKGDIIQPRRRYNPLLCIAHIGRLREIGERRLRRHPLSCHEPLGAFVENAHVVRFPCMMDASQRAASEIALPRILQKLKFVDARLERIGNARFPGMIGDEEQRRSNGPDHKRATEGQRKRRTNRNVRHPRGDGSFDRSAGIAFSDAIAFGDTLIEHAHHTQMLPLSFSYFFSPMPLTRWISSIEVNGPFASRSSRMA